MATTAKELAKQLGLSQSSVSRILSNSGRYRYSPETRERVLKAARDHGYHPNLVARGLRSRRTNTIGFYTSLGRVTSYDPFFLEVINGLGVGCWERGKNFRIYGVWPGRPEDDVLAELMGGQPDGLIVMLKPRDPLIERLAASDVPVVALADAVPELPSVVADDRGGSRLLAKHLAEKGHKRVYYRRRARNDQDECASSLRRYRAFREAADELGMTVTEGCAVAAEDSKQLLLGPEEAEWLAAPAEQRPTAAVCFDDASAYNFLAHCLRLGMRVPDDIAIAGFDGAATAMDNPYHMTTVCASWSSVVQTAVANVIALQDGEQVPQETVMPVKLVPGDTT